MFFQAYLWQPVLGFSTVVWETLGLEDYYALQNGFPEFGNRFPLNSMYIEVDWCFDFLILFIKCDNNLERALINAVDPKLTMVTGTSP